MNYKISSTCLDQVQNEKSLLRIEHQLMQITLEWVQIARRVQQLVRFFLFSNIQKISKNIHSQLPSVILFYFLFLGVIKAIHCGQTPSYNRITKDTVIFNASDFPRLTELLQLDLHEPPMSQVSGMIMKIFTIKIFSPKKWY